MLSSSCKDILINCLAIIRALYDKDIEIFLSIRWAAEKQDPNGVEAKIRRDMLQVAYYE